MKNSKAIFLIVLDAFVMATGFAFAKSNDPYQAESYKVLLDGPFAVPMVSAPVKSVKTPAGLESDLKLTTVVRSTGTTPPEVPASTEAAKPKVPFGQQVKGFIAGHKSEILLGGVGAYLGFALAGGPAGLLVGGLVALAFFWFVNLRK